MHHLRNVPSVWNRQPADIQNRELFLQSGVFVLDMEGQSLICADPRTEKSTRGRP